MALNTARAPATKGRDHFLSGARPVRQQVWAAGAGGQRPRHLSPRPAPSRGAALNLSAETGTRGNLREGGPAGASREPPALGGNSSAARHRGPPWRPAGQLPRPKVALLPPLRLPRGVLPRVSTARNSDTEGAVDKGRSGSELPKLSSSEARNLALASRT